MLPDIKTPMNKVDWLIAEFAKKDKPTVADFMRLRTIGGLYDGLDNYRTAAAKMSANQIKTEKHSSRRLGRHMTRAGDGRPSPRCDAHAIISGGHKLAVAMRGILAWLGMRVDDPFNGCWLPRDWQDRVHMPNYLRNGVPHCRIHHDKYYFWLNKYINLATIQNQDQLTNALRMVRVALQNGAVPPEVMPKTGR